MSDRSDYIARLERRLEREKNARQSAEALLEVKSRQLYHANQQLIDLAQGLEQRVAERTEELVAARERAIELAEIDQLTKLPNRARFHYELAAAVEQCAEKKTRVALLLIDLDRFKVINETLGHEAGDALLQHAASRLAAAARSRDVIARLGGNEFALICPSVESPAEVERITARMVASLQEPFVYKNRSLSTTCSVGVAVFPDDVADGSDLQRYADIALHRSKALGRGVCTRFNAAMDHEIQQRQWLEADVRRALAEGEFHAWYQPVVDSRTGRWSSGEVLARWHHPGRGIVMPAAFIGIIEELGLMRDMFRAMMLESCRRARRWVEAGLIRSIAVNVSPSQFKVGSLADDVLGILSAAAFPSSSLVLEITEEVLLSDLEGAQRQLQALAERGVRVALDDFGSGYSNIGYLRRLPIHAIKLDRSLTANVGTDEKARAIVAAVGDIARALELDVVAEGVETHGQSTWLTRCGCRYLQGYLYGRPMTPGDFESHFAGDKNPRLVMPAPSGLLWQSGGSCDMPVPVGGPALTPCRPAATAD